MEADLARLYAVTGETGQAKMILDKLLAQRKTEYFSAYKIATIYTGLAMISRCFAGCESRATKRIRGALDSLSIQILPSTVQAQKSPIFKRRFWRTPAGSLNDIPFPACNPSHVVAIDPQPPR